MSRLRRFSGGVYTAPVYPDIYLDQARTGLVSSTDTQSTIQVTTLSSEARTQSVQFNILASVIHNSLERNTYDASHNVSGAVPGGSLETTDTFLVARTAYDTKVTVTLQGGFKDFQVIEPKSESFMVPARTDLPCVDADIYSWNVVEGNPTTFKLSLTLNYALASDLVVKLFRTDANGPLSDQYVNFTIPAGTTEFNANGSVQPLIGQDYDLVYTLQPGDGYYFTAGRVAKLTVKGI